MGGLEEVERRPEEVPSSNEDLQDGIQVLGEGLDVEFKNSVEHFEGFFGKVSVAVETDDTGEEGRRDWVIVGFEEREEGVHEREMAGAAELEDESVESGVRMAEIGLTRG